jgi:hypothetical protein
VVQAASFARRYDSFVVRCWQLADDERRIEVEHLQSGARTRVLTLSAAAAWISSECGEGVISGERYRPAVAGDQSTKQTTD